MRLKALPPVKLLAKPFYTKIELAPAEHLQFIGEVNPAEDVHVEREEEAFRI